VLAANSVELPALLPLIPKLEAALASLGPKSYALIES